MRKRVLLLCLFGMLAVVFGSVAGCAKPTPAPMPTAAPTPTTTVATTATPGPTFTPSPTPTPLPPQPPKLLGRSPERGQEQLPTAPLVLRFDQAMDAASLQTALHIEPAVRGVISWDDPSTLRFIPAERGFARDSTYRVTIDLSARSAQRMPVATPIEFRFQTIGKLLVSEVYPQPGSPAVGTESVIRIVFNRPVVPLTGIREAGGQPEWLEITPPVTGKVTWTNTSILSLKPEGRLLPGTRYTVLVRAGLQDVTGGLLDADHGWSFTTELPDVVAVRPENGTRHVSPNAAIHIVFNQPMNQASTQERFSLTRGGAPATTPGRFAWEGTTLVFTPTQPLEMGGAYDLQLKQGAPSLHGDASVGKSNAWSFQVANTPQVTDSRPVEGDTRARLDEPWQIIFTGPISTSTFLKGLIIAPKARPYVWWENEDTVAHVAVQMKPSTWYTVTLTTDILGRYGHRLQESRTFHFRTRPYDPMVQFNVPDRVGSYNAYARPTVYLWYRNVSRVNLKLYTLPVEELIALNGEDSWSVWQEYRAKPANLVRSWSENASAPLNETGTLSSTLTTADGRALAPGLYYMEAAASEVAKPEKHVLIVSDTNLTLKSTQTEALVWATDLRDGLPVAGVNVSLHMAKGQLGGEATTDSAGVARITFLDQDPWLPITVLGRRGNGLSAVTRGWSRGLEPWDFRLPGEPLAQGYRAYFYTERRIYRPGQKVYFKGILRSDDDGRYDLLPRGTEVPVTIHDSQGRETMNSVLLANDMGTVNGEFDLSPDATLGYYSLQASYGQQYFSTDFQVAEYRKPEFQVQVSLGKAEYLQGDRIQAVAEAGYFSGGPVTGAAVHWRVMRQPFFFSRWQGQGYFDFSDYEDEFQPLYGPSGEFVTEGDGQTDDQGRFTFSVPADVSQHKQSQSYTIEASVVDLSNQEVSARSAAVVHKGDFYIGLAPTSYVGSVGQQQTVRAITVDTQGLTRTTQALQVVFHKHEWYSVQELAEDGNFYWTSKVRDTAVATQTIQTDSQGQALASFTPTEGGVYRVLARGQDGSGNEVRSSAYLWVSAEEFVSWRQESNNRLDLVADKKSYKPGETAQVLIPSPYQGTTTALVTIERGRVLEHRLIQIRSNSERLSLPILPDYSPNVFLSVVIVKGMDKADPVPSFRLGYVMIAVSTERKELAVTITPDRKSPYKPRGEVTYEIQARDYQGHGVEAEMSLQLVDLAVESLAGADPRDIVQEFYRQRGLGVSTATTLAVSVDRHNLERVSEGKGGGGGAAEGPMVRQFLPDTAFWAPTVRTDSSGKARVTVALPDNLTTWRMRAQVVTAQTEVGRASVDITTSLEVMVRPVTPRFMVIGDRPTLGAIVHNNTAEDLQVEVSLAAQGASVKDARQTVGIPAHGRTAVSWPAVVLESEQAALHFSATGGKYADAIEIKLPVYHPSTPETVGTSGQVDERVIELVRVPEQVDRGLGELTVILEPSLASGMREGLRYLETYPYDCIEQTVSRFLPNVVTYRALRKLNVKREDLESTLPQKVGAGLQRLYALQNLDGGWGWWGADESSPVLSAYAYLGLVEARRAQFSVDSGVYDRATTYLLTWLEQDTKESAGQRNTRAVVLYVLAEAGQGDLGRTVALFDRREALPLYARGYLLMTLQLLDPNEASRLTTLTSDLADAAILSATSVHWEEAQPDVIAMNTDIRTTAIVLRALARVQPDSRLLPGAVRWLMAARSSGRWESTQENAWSILALTDFMATTGELTADYTYRLLLGGETLAKGVVTSQTVDQSIGAQTPISALRPHGDNDVIIDRTMAAGQEGTGKLYYSVFLRYFLPAEGIKALDRGIIVGREYTLATDPSRPVSEAAVNDTVVVTLTLIAPHDLYHLVLEDPLPAGCEAVDTSLLTTSQAAQGPEFGRKRGGPTVGSSPPWMWYWPSHVELHDERVSLFASHLSAGTYEYSYSLRCTTPGEYKVMPATAYEMYFADVFGRSDGARFTVSPGK